MLAALKPSAKYLVNSVVSVLPAPARKLYKEHHEMRFWKGVAAPMRHDQSRMEHERSHYEQFYTSFFGVSRDDYAGKRILDIGCGPCGSLEWADMTAERVGLDPLADKYQKLLGGQRMTYCNAPSEKMPFPDAHFDSVSTFNSLDHVDDVDATIAEIKRVTRPGGRLLLIVEIGHAPTPAEPHHLEENLADRFAPQFRLVSQRLYGVRDDHNVYGSMMDAIPFVPGEEGILAAHLERVIA